MQAVIHHPSIHEPGGLRLRGGVGAVVALAHIVLIAWLLAWGHAKLAQAEQGKALMVTMIPAPVQEQAEQPPAPVIPPPPKREAPPLVTAVRQAVPAESAPVVPPEPVVETPVVEAVQEPVAAAPSAAPAEAAAAPAAVPSLPLANIRMAYLNNKMVYPPDLRRRGIQGKAILKVLVSPEGRVLNIELQRSSGNTELDHAAMRGVRDWKFAPFTGAGAVPSSAIVPINFELK